MLGRLLLLSTLVVLAPSADASAQCGCTPPRTGEFSDAIQLIVFPGTLTPDELLQLGGAIDNWNVRLSAAGAPGRFSTDSGNRIVQVRLDPALIGTDIWGTADQDSDVLWINPDSLGSGPFLDFLFRHELGHFAGFGDVWCGQGFGASVMQQFGRFDPGYPTALTCGDRAAIGGSLEDPDEYWCRIDPQNCTPIVINLDAQSIKLSDVPVWFDIAANGFSAWISWTRAESRDGWLVLDRNDNGTIDDGREMFGGVTPLGYGPDATRAADGFEALRWFDELSHGGDANGVISSVDGVFRSLRLWVDSNHDGTSQPHELMPLDDVGIVAIELDARSSEHRDSLGNWFWRRAKVYVHEDGTRPLRVRFAYDVVLTNAK